MASARTYDENLLSQAPEVTKADLQDGYNPDLLRQPTVKRTPSTRARQTTPPGSGSDTLQHQYNAHDKDIESSAAPLQPKEGIDFKQTRVPWWRTVKGLVIIFIIVIAIILAAVLGGVLGSKKRSSTVGGPEEGSVSHNDGGGSAGGNGQEGSQPAPGDGNNAGGPRSSAIGGTSRPSPTGTAVNQPEGTGPATSNNSGQLGGSLAVPPPQATTGGGNSDTVAPVGQPLGNGRRDGSMLEVMMRDLGVEV